MAGACCLGVLRPNNQPNGHILAAISILPQSAAAICLFTRNNATYVSRMQPAGAASPAAQKVLAGKVQQTENCRRAYTLLNAARSHSEQGHAAPKSCLQYVIH